MGGNRGYCGGNLGPLFGSLAPHGGKSLVSPFPIPPPLCIALVLSSFAPCFLLFLFGRVHATSRPALSVRRLVSPSHCFFWSFSFLLGLFGSYWVVLGHFGSSWVRLGRFWSSGSRTRLIGVFRETPNFFGVPPCSFNVDLACLCTCVFHVCMGVCRGNVLMPIEPCVFFYIL